MRMTKIARTPWGRQAVFLYGKIAIWELMRVFIGLTQMGVKMGSTPLKRFGTLLD